MSSKRKKLKKSPHYREADVSEESVAGKIRRRNEATQAQLDELD